MNDSSINSKYGNNIEEGQVVLGTVKNFTDFGAFIDLGDIDGLLHISDISWNRISHPSEILELNQEINVQILRLNFANGHISLGFKQLHKPPKILRCGDIIEGTIKKIVGKGYVVGIDRYIAFLPFKESIKYNYTVDDKVICAVKGNDLEGNFNNITLSQLPLHKKFAESHKEHERLSVFVESTIHIEHRNAVVVRYGYLSAVIDAKKITEPYRNLLLEQNLDKGICLYVEYTEYDEEKGIVKFDMRPIEKEKVEEANRKKQEQIEDLLKFVTPGDVAEAEVTSVNDKFAKVNIIGTDIECTIPREELSPNKVIRASDEVFVGERIKIVYVGYQNGEMQFSRRYLIEDRYDQSLYTLSLMELLGTIGIHTNRFVGKAVERNGIYFITQLMSIAEVGTEDNGLLLVDPQSGQNLIAFVNNRLKKLIVPGKYYEVNLVLASEEYRKEQGTPYQFSIESSDIKECNNPYEQSVSHTFKKLDSPSANSSLSNLLEEVGIGMYRSKKRMFFELLQNADDAAPINGVKVKLQFSEDYFVITHNGFSFNRQDFYSITSAAKSTKSSNNKKTGYKGIGFKSVFTNSSKVLIKSGGYTFSFDKENPLFEDFKRFYFFVKGIESDVIRQDDFLIQNEQEFRLFKGVKDIPWQLLPIWQERATLPFKNSIFNGNENVAIALKMDEDVIQEYRSAIYEIFEYPRFMLFLRRTKRIQLKAEGEWLTIQKEISDDGKNVTILNSFSSKSKVEVYRIFAFEDIPVTDDAFEFAGILIRKVERINSRGEKEMYFVHVDEYGSIGAEIIGVPDRIASTDKTEISFAVELDQNGEIQITQNYNSSLYAYLPMNEYRFKFPLFINADFIPGSNREEINSENPWNAYLFYCIGNSIIKVVKDFASESYPDYLSLLPSKELDINNTETQLLANTFNRAYIKSLQNEAFILNDQGQLSRQDEIIIDNSGLSSVIDNDVFFKIIGLNKRLVSSAINSDILKESLFNLIEQINEADVLKALGEIDSLKKFCEDLSSDNFNGLLRWLSAVSDLPKVLINRFPCFSDGVNVFSYEELILQNFIILTDKTAPVRDILKQLGFNVYENISPAELNFPSLSEKEIFTKIKKQIEGLEVVSLTANDKLLLFNFFMSLEGVADVTCSEIRLFKNVTGEIKPLNSMLSFRIDAPEWLHPYMICNEENFSEVTKLLLPDDKTFEKVIWPNRKSINISLKDIFTYCHGPKESYLVELVSTSSNNNELAEFIDFIVQSSDELKIQFLNRIQPLHLDPKCHYGVDSFESKVISLIIESWDKLDTPEAFSNKIYYGDKCVNEFSIKDDVVCKYEVQGVLKIVKFSLVELLPSYKNISDGIKKVKDLFDITITDKLFAAKSKLHNEIADELKKLLNVSPGIWKPGTGTAEQYLFLNFHYKYERNYVSDWVMPITLSDQSQDFVSSLMDCMFSNKIVLKDSPFAYRFYRQICNKYFINLYATNEESIPNQVETWADSKEKRDYLISNNVLSADSKIILLRKAFLSDEAINVEKESLSNDIARNVLSFALTKTNSFDGKNQQSFLLWIYKNLSYCLTAEVDIDRLTKNALEWQSDEYRDWRSNSKPTIFLFSGEVPYLLKYNSKIVAKFSEKWYWYDTPNKKLYISKEKDIDDLLFEIARVHGTYFTLSDFDQLCRKGKISVSRDAIKEKDDRIASLEQEIKRLRSGSSEVENPGFRIIRGHLTEVERKQVNADACIQAYEYLSNITGYDCSSWDYQKDGRIVKSVIYNGHRIVVVITSSNAGYIYLNPYAFAQLMENPENLLVNVKDGEVRTFSFKDLFEENPDVNLIFDSRVVTPEIFAELANKFIDSEKTCFVVANPNYSASDQIKGFGLSEKMKGGSVITFTDDVLIW